MLSRKFHVLEDTLEAVATMQPKHVMVQAQGPSSPFPQFNSYKFRTSTFWLHCFGMYKLAQAVVFLGDLGRDKLVGMTSTLPHHMIIG